METDDAIEDLIETSDAEERELDNATNPEYYDRVWGALAKTSVTHIGRHQHFLNDDLLVSSSSQKDIRPVAHRTFPSSQHKLGIDIPFIQGSQDFTSMMPGLTASHLVSLAPSETSTCSPHSRYPIQRNEVSLRDISAENDFGSSHEPASSQDPICLFSPVHIKGRQTSSPRTSKLQSSDVCTPVLTVVHHNSNSNVKYSPRSPVTFVLPDEDAALPATPPYLLSSRSPAFMLHHSSYIPDSGNSSPSQKCKQRTESSNKDRVHNSTQSSSKLPASSPGMLLPLSDLSSSEAEKAPQRSVTSVSFNLEKGVRFMSPLTPPPPTREPTPKAPSSLPSQPVPSLPLAVSPDPEPQGRPYSLRSRSAKQLNPFEYDKRQYKNLLRGMPEAIVKATLGGWRKDLYREEGDWEGSCEEDGEGDEEWAAQEKRKAKRLEREQQCVELDATMRELGIEISSGEDDLSFLDAHHAAENPRQGKNSKRKKRTRNGKNQDPFPMCVQEKIESFPRTNSVPSAESSVPKPRPRPRPLRKRPPSSPHLSSTDPGHVDVDCDYDVTNNYDDDGRVSGKRLPSTSHRYAIEEDDCCSSIVNISDDEANSHRLTRGHARLQSDSDGLEVRTIEKDHIHEHTQGHDGRLESSEEENEMTAKDRKRLKILHRMMPAALIRKLVAQEEDKSRHRVRLIPKHQEYDEGRSDHREVPLQPGRGIKRFVGADARDPGIYMVNGDAESETDSEQILHGEGQEMIAIDSNDEEDHGQRSEQDVEKAFEESKDGLDNEDISTWLALQPVVSNVTIGAKGSGGASSKGRPSFDRDRPRSGDLIDRMLQRTRRIGPRVAKTSNRTNGKTRWKGHSKSADQFEVKERKPSKIRILRQTRLPFETRYNAYTTTSNTRYVGRNRIYDKIGHNKSHNHFDRDILDNKDPGKRKRKRYTLQNRNGPEVYINQNSGVHVTSGRPRQVIHIDADDDMFHDALAPVEVFSRHSPRNTFKTRPKHVQNVRECFHDDSRNDNTFAEDPTDFAPKRNKISLDFDVMPLPSGIKVSSDGYVGKGRLFELMAFINGTHEVAPPSMFMAFGLQIDPDTTIPDLSSVLSSAFDKLYNEAVIPLSGLPDISSAARTADAIMYALRQQVTFKALHCKDDEENLLFTIVSEQLKHLLGRIDSRLELLSADGHALDFRSFTLYWFSVELHLRLIYARRRRLGTNEVEASDPVRPDMYNATQLLRRLLEYGVDRLMSPLREEGLALDMTSPNIHVLDMWICLFHIAPHLVNTSHHQTPGSACPFWSMVEAALELQSNQPEQQLYKSEYIWQTVFSLCALSQFTSQGIVTSSVRLRAHWPIIKKAFGIIRLNADDRDNSTPAFILQKQDTYLRLVTARCYLLTVRWNWSLIDADDIFHGLCAIFRSRQFSNLLGEPDDFPTFIRSQDERLFHVYQATDTAYSLFLKLIIRAVKDFSDKDSTGRLRSVKLSRLLSLTVPVGSMSFSKATPPVFQALSMLYNRYSAVFVAIYVDPSDKHIRSRLQQIRRYIAFKDADSDSRTAAIRALLHLAILLQHLDKPLDDILNWASEMLEDLLAELSPNLGPVEAYRQTERDKVIFSAQMLVRSITTIMRTSGLASSVQKPSKYPDIAFIQVLLPRLISGSLVKDHRTGLEICGYIQSFLNARRAVLPSPMIPRPNLQDGKQESQDDYGDGGLDLNDPMLLALLDNVEPYPDEDQLADKKASEIMDGFSQSLYTCVCMHLGCNVLDCNYDEADEWLKIWLGYGSVLVRNKKRDWNYYFQLAESASRDIVDAFRRIHIRLRVATTILWLDYSIYKSLTDYFVKLWVEALISPDITIQHEFSAVLFSVDSLRHPLLRDIPYVQVDPVSGYFSLERNVFKERRLQIVTTILRNASFTWRVLGTEEFIPYIEMIFATLRKWKEVMVQESRSLDDYDAFSREIFSAARSHDSLARHPQFKSFFEAAQ